MTEPSERIKDGRGTRVGENMWKDLRWKSGRQLNYTRTEKPIPTVPGGVRVPVQTCSRAHGTPSAGLHRWSCPALVSGLTVFLFLRLLSFWNNTISSGSQRLMKHYKEYVLPFHFNLKAYIKNILQGWILRSEQQIKPTNQIAAFGNKFKLCASLNQTPPEMWSQLC